jgi:DNA-directed RNA polymerase subunit L
LKTEELKVRLSKQDKDELKRQAENLDMTMSEYLREMVRKNKYLMQIKERAKVKKDRGI